MHYKYVVALFFCPEWAIRVFVSCLLRPESVTICQIIQRSCLGCSNWRNIWSVVVALANRLICLWKYMCPQWFDCNASVGHHVNGVRSAKRQQIVDERTVNQRDVARDLCVCVLWHIIAVTQIQIGVDCWWWPYELRLMYMLIDRSSYIPRRSNKTHLCVMAKCMRCYCEALTIT